MTVKCALKTKNKNMNIKNKKQLYELMPLNQLTEYCYYSQEYLSLLARRKKLKSKKIGRVWHSKPIWLFEYIKENSLDRKGNYKGNVTPEFDSLLRKYNLYDFKQDSGKKAKKQKRNFLFFRKSIKLSQQYLFFKSSVCDICSSLKDKVGLITGKNHKPFSAPENKYILNYYKSSIANHNRNIESNFTDNSFMSDILLARFSVWFYSFFARLKIWIEDYRQNSRQVYANSLTFALFVGLTIFGVLMSGSINIGTIKIKEYKYSAIDYSFDYVDKNGFGYPVLSKIQKTNFKTAKTENYSKVLGYSDVDYLNLFFQKINKVIKKVNKIAYLNYQMSSKISENGYLRNKKYDKGLNYVFAKEHKNKEIKSITDKKQKVFIIEVPEDITERDAYDVLGDVLNNVYIDVNVVNKSGIVWPDFDKGYKEKYIYLIIN